MKISQFLKSYKLHISYINYYKINNTKQYLHGPQIIKHVQNKSPKGEVCTLKTSEALVRFSQQQVWSTLLYPQVQCQDWIHYVLASTTKSHLFSVHSIPAYTSYYSCAMYIKSNHDVCRSLKPWFGVHAIYTCLLNDGRVRNDSTIPALLPREELYIH